MTKKEFVEGPLAETLRCANLGIEQLALKADGDVVRVIYDNGYMEEVNIEADGFGAIILDVTRKALY